jgi:hypothetical protein
VELGCPARVDSVINHRVINGKHVVAGVSGGVRVDPRQLVSQAAVQIAEIGEMAEYRQNSTAAHTRGGGIRRPDSANAAAK